MMPACGSANIPDCLFSALRYALARLSHRCSSAGATMSQQSSLTQSAHSVRQVLTAYTYDEPAILSYAISSFCPTSADGLHKQGYELGDNGALLSAIERCKRLVDLTSRERIPLQWASSQISLGNALLRLGEREGGKAKLEEAVIAFREALKEHTHERELLYWAMIQNSLGLVLTRLGERETETAKLEEAVVAFREALKEYTSERAPLEWAVAQSNQGLALWTLGDLQSETANLER